MKVIFLDHDGVICLPNEWGGRSLKRGDSIDVKFDDFDIIAIKVLNEILEMTDCEIVISSDWRRHATLEQLQELYTIRGIKKIPIGMTECEPTQGMLLQSARVTEIQNFLSSHPEITKWVAIDDMNLSKLENFVRTSPFGINGGIKGEGVKERIIEFLK